jgi:hypothetical protein
MPLAEVAIHHAAGRFYGEATTCRDEQRSKTDYGNIDTATRVAGEMSEKHNRELEAYPCCWCGGWHIGRTMTAQERQRFGKDQT